MKKWLIVAGLVPVIGVCLIVGSFLLCLQIVDRKEARVDPVENTIHCVISGYYLLPVSVEGPFPHWSNDLLLTLKPGRRLPATGRQEFTLGQDFTVRYDMVKAGTILVDADRRVVTVEVQYVDDYWWCKVNGDFPLRRE